MFVEQCGKAGEWEQGRAVMMKMRNEGIEPNGIMLTSLITAYAKVMSVTELRPLRANMSMVF